jgi:hypothetical protein
MKHVKSLILLSLSFFMLASYAFAADTLLTPEEAAVAAEKSRLSAGTASIYTDYFSGDLNEDEFGDGYIKPSYERLSQLYWALAMLDLEDNEAIDGYLMLHECDLYKQFFSRDFELNELRKVTRESIIHNIASFPTKFEIFMPIGLDRYDIPSKKFRLTDKSKFINAKKLEVSRNALNRRVCSSSYIPKYPRNFILYFNRPFSFTEIPMEPDVAQDIIDFAEEDQKKERKGKHFEFKDYSPLRRIVFLRLKVSMSQYKEMERNYSDDVVPVIFATIDAYQVFFDQERTLLIYDYEIETKRRLEKLKSGMDHKPADLPEGPLLKEGIIEKSTVPQSVNIPMMK